MRISDWSSDVCSSDLDYIEVLMQDSGIIRNRLKLRATRQNANAWLAQPDPVDLIWSFVGGKPKINHYARHQDIPLITPEAEHMSRTLKKAGFTFVGPTIRSEEHTSELQSLMRNPYTVF